MLNTRSNIYFIAYLVKLNLTIYPVTLTSKHTSNVDIYIGFVRVLDVFRPSKISATVPETHFDITDGC